MITLLSIGKIVGTVKKKIFWANDKSTKELRINLHKQDELKDLTPDERLYELRKIHQLQRDEANKKL